MQRATHSVLSHSLILSCNDASWENSSRFAATQKKLIGSLCFSGVPAMLTVRTPYSIHLRCLLTHDRRHYSSPCWLPASTCPSRPGSGERSFATVCSTVNPSRNRAFRYSLASFRTNTCCTPAMSAAVVAPSPAANWTPRSAALSTEGSNTNSPGNSKAAQPRTADSDVKSS